MWDVGRHRLPLGIAVVGRAYRNEIAPRQVLFRMRAFTQAELQIFFDPAYFDVPLDRVRDEQLPVLRVARREAGEESPSWETAGALVDGGQLPAFYVYHLVHTYRFYRDVLRYPADRIRLFEKSDAERAFYNRIQFDVEVKLESLGSYKELGAVHYRGDYDLSRHSEGSGRDLSITLDGGTKLLPHVLELTFGVDRNLWALADLHLTHEGERTVWKLPPYLAPVAVGVLPLMVKEHAAYAERLAEALAAAGLRVQYDESGAIGRRYARLDEAGTPYAVTVDGTTVSEGPDRDTVTLRERDSKSQERVRAADVAGRILPTLVPPRPPRA